MSDMRKKVEDAYATKGDNAEAYLLGVALSLLSQIDQAARDGRLYTDGATGPLGGDIRDFRAAIEDHQRAFYDSLPS